MYKICGNCQYWNCIYSKYLGICSKLNPGTNTLDDFKYNLNVQYSAINNDRVKERIVTGYNFGCKLWSKKR